MRKTTNLVSWDSHFKCFEHRYGPTNPAHCLFLHAMFWLGGRSRASKEGFVVHFYPPKVVHEFTWIYQMCN